jgi:tetratricopeptide (TPR) repeat protein
MKSIKLTLRSSRKSGAAQLPGRNLLALAVVLAFALTFSIAPRASAQLGGSVSGQILDIAGKPWADIGVEAVSDQGAKSSAKTDKNGNFTFTNLRAGEYSISVLLPAPNQPYMAAKVRVSSGSEAPKVNINFKDIAGKQGKEFAETQKKQEEDKQKFQGMKAHFDAGAGFLTQAVEAKAQLAKAPADQRDTLKQQVTELSGKAVTEFEAAKAAAPEKDSNLPLILARLGDAYDAAGRIDDAAGAYKQAVELKPSVGYYNNLGNIYGRAGKLPEAMAAYQKSAELDPANAAQAWRNAGITFYNANKMKEAVEPLKKATEADPKNAQSWYLLGAALVGSMEFKKVGDKDVPVLQPGTVEAYEKAAELDPNGTYGLQAKQALEALQQMAPGIQTKVSKKKKG